jgi:hypothetical protein
MKTKLAAFSIAAALAISTAVPAFAAPGDEGQGVGGCIDNFYGNATNERPDGNGVLPSQSPGPWVNNPTDPDNPTPGPSVGDAVKFGKLLGLNATDLIPLLCEAP